MCSCMIVCSLMAAYIKPIIALNCGLQVDQVKSENRHSDNDPLALALHSLRFLSALQTLFAS